jgi:hypothetical protein
MVARQNSTSPCWFAVDTTCANLPNATPRTPRGRWRTWLITRRAVDSLMKRHRPCGTMRRHHPAAGDGGSNGLTPVLVSSGGEAP